MRGQSALSVTTPLLNPVAWVRPNYYDQYLVQVHNSMAQLERAGGLKRICCPAGQSGTNPPWIAQPPQARRYQSISTVVASALAGTEGTDVPMTDSFIAAGSPNGSASFRVPTGYDGVILSVTNLFTSMGFVEGSGDISWRIRINQRWLKDYGNIQTTLGSFTAPCPIFRGAVRVYSQQVVTYYVQLAIGALTRIDPNGIINCALWGYFYPAV